MFSINHFDPDPNLLGIPHFDPTILQALRGTPNGMSQTNGLC